MKTEEGKRRTTLAEAEGMTAEIGGAILSMAAAELEAGRLERASILLEGLAVANPLEPEAWALLSQVHRRADRQRAARACAEVAARLAPGQAAIKLVRAEVLLGDPAQAARARADLGVIAAGQGPASDRARALLRGCG
jgi:predicted Zn-dependent protease